jgi:hypothetical protein
MSVKIRQRFRVTNGIGVEDWQRSAGERDIDSIEETATRVSISSSAPTAVKAGGW